jgi:hypothetical protein
MTNLPASFLMRTAASPRRQGTPTREKLLFRETLTHPIRALGEGAAQGYRRFYWAPKLADAVWGAPVRAYF